MGLINWKIQNQEMMNIFSKINKYSIILCGILLLSLFLQLSTITWGLPDKTGENEFSVDEILCGNIILKMIQHQTLNPNWFVESSGQLYFVFVPSWIFNAVIHKVTLTDIVIFERIVSILFSLSTIVAVFYIGKEIKNELLGVTAAFFLTVNPYYFIIGTCGKQDAAVTFFVTLSLFLILLYLKHDNNQYAYVSAFSAGLATSCKYIGGLMFLFILGIILADTLLKQKSIQLQKKLPKILLVVVLLFIIGFVLLTPYSVLTPDNFLKGSIGEYTHYQTAHTGIGQFPVYYFILVFIGMDFMRHVPGMLVSSIFFLTGVVLILKSEDSEKNLSGNVPVLLYWVLMVFITFSFFIKIKFANQMVMAVPAMMIFAAYPLYLLLQSKGYLTKPKIIAILLIFLTTASVILVIDHRLHDNRYRAADWISEHVSPEQSIAKTGYVYTPFGYNNTISASPGNLSWFKTAKNDYFIASSTAYDRYLFFKNDYPEINAVYTTISDTPVGGIVGNYMVVKQFSMTPRLSQTTFLNQVSRIFSNNDGEVDIIIMKNIESQNLYLTNFSNK